MLKEKKKRASLLKQWAHLKKPGSAHVYSTRKMVNPLLKLPGAGFWLGPASLQGEAQSEMLAAG